MWQVKVYDGTTYRGQRLFAELHALETYLDESHSLYLHFNFVVKQVLPDPKILRAPELQRTFPEQYERVKKGCCAKCEQPINPETFRDPRDIKEYELSGYCKKCIDKVFTE